VTSRTSRKARGARYTAPKQATDRRVAWYAPIMNVSGYADEARQFVHHLRGRGLTVGARNIAAETPGLWSALRQSAPALAASLEDALRLDLAGAPLSVLHLTGDVVHRVPGSRRTVARTMYETDRIPADWVAQLNTVDEVWVPSHFNLETFRTAGVTTAIEVVPGGVDTERFRPGCEPLALDGVRGTVFLSVFEWSHRKGPDVLLRAWAEAFSPADDVTLVLRAFPRGFFGDGDATAAVEQLVEAELSRIGRRRQDVARIVVLGRHLPPDAMPRLLCTADAYVSPTRGEGWGRPLIEAMACGLPVVATRWSGQLEFMNDGNAMLIDVEGLVDVGKEMDVFHYRGHRWAEPSVDHLVSLLRRVVERPGELGTLAGRARTDVEAHWTWDHAAAVAARRISELSDTRRRRPGVTGNDEGSGDHEGSGTRAARVRWSGDVYALHSLARVNRELIRLLRRDDSLLLDVVTGEQGPLRPDTRARLGIARDGLRQPRWSTPAVEVRHSWPPDLSAGPPGVRLVVIQPWELGVVPASWVPPMQSRVDEIWTHTSYSRECFVRAGIDPAKVQVIPLGADPAVFHPEGARYPLATTKTCTFLYVGGTIPRKGFDVALDAYLEAFGPDDDVCLVVKPFLSDAHYRLSNLDERLRRAAADPSNPAIEIIEETNLSDEDLAGLYRSCDVLLAPYRGEGFGLPILEAMASGVPAVVTGYGASLDFCDESTSWLVPAREVTLTVEGEQPARGEFRWAEPERDALVRLLRVARADEASRVAKATAGVARAAAFTWQSAATSVRERLHLLAAIGDEKTARAPRRASGPGEGSLVRPLVSACMIVKDEAQQLGDCLRSIRGLVDELVVGDTGSSDGTADIARSFGAEVHSIAWEDDFAAARNAVLRQCRGEWILWIDADERFEGDPELVRAALVGADGDGLQLEIDNLQGSGIAGVTTHSAVRLFRRGLRWAGRVHEQVVRSDGRGLHSPVFTGARLVHLGYTDALLDSKEKRQRNLHLAKLSLRDARGRTQRDEAELNLGRSYLLAGCRAEALEHLERAARSSVPVMARVALATAIRAEIDDGDYESARRRLEELRTRSSLQVSCDLLAGEIALGEGQPEEALRWFATLAAPTHDDDHFLHSPLEVAHLVAACHRLRGDHAAAARTALDSLVSYGRYPEHLGIVLQDLALAGRDPIELGRALPAGSERLWLAQLTQVEPDAGLRVLDGVLEQRPESLAVLAAAEPLARRASADRSLLWSARLAQRGIAERPVMTVARDVRRPLGDRLLAAAGAVKGFDDQEAASVLSELLGDVDTEGAAKAREIVERVLGQERGAAALARAGLVGSAASPVTRVAPRGWKASIVLPCLNGAASTLRFVRSVAATAPAGEYQLVIVDNGSSDATGRLESSPDGAVVVVRNEATRSLAAAMNQGAAAADAPVVLLGDNALVPHHGWLTPLVAALDDASVGVAGPLLFCPDGRVRHGGMQLLETDGMLRGVPEWSRRRIPRSDITSGERRLVGDELVAIRRDVLLRVHGLDETCGSGLEVADLCLRLGALGYRVRFVAESELTHAELGPQLSAQGSDRPSGFRPDPTNAARFTDRWRAGVVTDDRRDGVSIAAPFGTGSVEDRAARVLAGLVRDAGIPVTTRSWPVGPVPDECSWRHRLGPRQRVVVAFAGPDEVERAEDADAEWLDGARATCVSDIQILDALVRDDHGAVEAAVSVLPELAASLSLESVAPAERSGVGVGPGLNAVHGSAAAGLVARKSSSRRRPCR